MPAGDPLTTDTGDPLTTDMGDPLVTGNGDLVVIFSTRLVDADSLYAPTVAGGAVVVPQFRYVAFRI
jgi:hypothetical protein